MNPGGRVPARNEPTLSDPQDAIERLVRGPVVSVVENVTLRSLAAVLSAADIGAALALSAGASLSMVSERDVARALADDVDPDESGRPMWQAPIW